MKLNQPNWKQVRGRNLRITALHWHYALIAVLCLLNLVLAVKLLYAWKRAQAGDAARLREREAEYRVMQLKTRPLRGLDRKIVRAKSDQTAFYEKRFPATYSAVLTELGALAVKNNVLLGRVQYAQGKLDQGAYEIRMDASLTGDYAPIVRFINGLERDKIFFIIDGIALSGQQSGVVSLRMRLTTYLQVEPRSAGAASASNGSAESGPSASPTTVAKVANRASSRAPQEVTPREQR